MDKYIIDKLVNFGLITNVGVDASKYEDVDDLINKGIITIPGAKAKIAELLNPINPPLILVEKTDDEPQVVDNTADVNEVDNNTTEPETIEPETTETVEVAETEIVVEETVEETVEDNKKKSKKA